MLVKFNLAILIALISLSLCGCQQENAISTSETFKTYSYQQDMVSIPLLASQLGMRVDHINSNYVRLKNAANTVLIFTHTGGQFFVNGREIGPVGQISIYDGTTYVPQSVAGQIRSAMQQTYTFRPDTYNKYLSGTVVLDPGHGGKDPGAISVQGFYEKGVNMSVAQKTAAKLKQRGISVIMTRYKDEFIELERRAEIANENRADLFVSIHADSSLNRSTKGYTVYIAEDASSGSQAAAKAISQRMSQITSNGNGIRRENYRVLVKTKMPAVLLEMGYISNHGEANLIATDSFQNKVAQALSDGICDIINRL